MEALNNPGLNIASFNENPLVANKDGEKEVKKTKPTQETFVEDHKLPTL